MRKEKQIRGRQSGLTGLWTGYYAYDMTDDAVLFTAWLHEEGGIIRGSVLEENLSAADLYDEFESDVLGRRHGLDVRFSKRFLFDFGRKHPPLRYHGDTDSDCSVISGVWFFDDPADWTGTFMMTRISKPLTAPVIAQQATRADNDRDDEG